MLEACHGKPGFGRALALAAVIIALATADASAIHQARQKYDQLGNVTEASPPGWPATQYEPDSRGAVKKETLPGGAENNFVDHQSGAQSEYTDPDSESTSTINDLIGRPLVRTYADGTIERVEYEGPRIKSVTDRQGRRQVFTYNGKGKWQWSRRR